MPNPIDSPKFDLQAEIDAIDRRRAMRQVEMDRLDAQTGHLWPWFVAAFVLPIAVGVFLGLAL